MKKILVWLRHEPVLVGAAIDIGITWAAAKGFHLSAEQIALVFTVVSAIIGVPVRQMVSPTT